MAMPTGGPKACMHQQLKALNLPPGLTSDDGEAIQH